MSVDRNSERNPQVDGADRARGCAGGGVSSAGPMPMRSRRAVEVWPLVSLRPILMLMMVWVLVGVGDGDEDDADDHDDDDGDDDEDDEDEDDDGDDDDHHDADADTQDEQR